MSCEEDEDEPFDSPELLKQVLFDFYDGITDRDFDKIKEVTISTPILTAVCKLHCCCLKLGVV